MNLNIDIISALTSLLPGAKWAFQGEVTYENLLWIDTEIAKPSKTILDAEVARLQSDYTSKLYQRNRAKEYPSIADQLDTLYHSGLDAWKAEIKTVKDKYPKPN